MTCPFRPPSVQIDIVFAKDAQAHLDERLWKNGLSCRVNTYIQMSAFADALKRKPCKGLRGIK